MRLALLHHNEHSDTDTHSSPQLKPEPLVTCTLRRQPHHTIHLRGCSEQGLQLIGALLQLHVLAATRLAHPRLHLRRRAAARL